MQKILNISNQPGLIQQLSQTHLTSYFSSLAKKDSNATNVLSGYKSELIIDDKINEQESYTEMMEKEDN